MSTILNTLRANDGSKIMIAARLIAALPLIAIGIGHLFDRGSFAAMLEAASIPMPGLNTVLAPTVEIVAGALLLLSLFARLGGLMALSTMAVALYSHAVIDPAALPEGVMMPPLVLPLAVLAAAALVSWRGAGAFSLDAKQGTSRDPVAAEPSA